MIKGRIKRILEEEKKKALSSLSRNPAGCLRDLLRKADVNFTVEGDKILVETLEGDTVVISVKLVKNSDRAEL